MEKLCGALLTLTMLLALLPCRAEAVQLSAAAAILMDADSGEILFEKDAGRCMRIASTTKIMTALVALERAKLTDTITVTASHMVEGSSMYLKPGETVTVEELLYGLMLCSGNDAALALADCCGGLDAFVQAMNEKAAALGMKDTSFANPNGLDDENHYSTAQDMAVLAAYAAEDPTFRRICSTKTATVGGRSMTNHNKLLRQIEGCIGMKTGYTKAAGRTLVSCAERQGRRLVAVTLCDGNDWVDHKTLYEMGFAAYETKTRRKHHDGTAAKTDRPLRPLLPSGGGSAADGGTGDGQRRCGPAGRQGRSGDGRYRRGRKAADVCRTDGVPDAQ